MRLVGAQRAVVGVKVKYQDVIDLLKGQAALGHGSGRLAGRLPAGDEFILIYDVLRPGDSAGRHPPERGHGGDEGRDGDEHRQPPPRGR